MACRPLGIWWSLVANGIAACGGVPFFFATPSSRFRGMEPEAALFIAFSLLGTLVGLLAAFPISIRDLFWRRFWVWGIVGTFLAFTPLFTAGFVSDLAVWQLNVFWD